MRVLKTKWFERFASSERISDDDLVDLVNDAETGLIDARLGRHLIKQRLARPGQGARGGFRIIIAWVSGELAVFIYGFPKSERENLAPDELKDWRDVASIYADFTDAAIDKAIKAKEAFEIEVDVEEDGVEEEEDGEED